MSSTTFPATESWSLIELLTYFGPKVGFAVLCGGLVGLERELKNKAAGIKTNILICLGAALYSALSVLISSSGESGQFGDPGRITAQIVSGIGFLGGGSIIQSRGTVQGLTTAATIWAMAAIGICIGVGHAELGLACSITIVLVLILTNVFEDRVFGRTLLFHVDVVVEDDSGGKSRQAINEAISRNELSLEDFGLKPEGPHSVLSIRYRGHRADRKKFILDLWSIPGIREVRQNA